jgi:hypothetical protein
MSPEADVPRSETNRRSCARVAAHILSKVPATAAIRWLRTDEGGRLTGPPIGPRYMSTAILADDLDADYPAESHFSVVIDFEEGKAS